MWFAQLDASGIFHVFIYEWLFTRMFIYCCCNLMFYDWNECVMSVLGTTKHFSRAISLLTLGNKVILYYIVLSPWQLNISPHPSQPTHVSSFHFHSLSIQKHTSKSTHNHHSFRKISHKIINAYCCCCEFTHILILTKLHHKFCLKKMNIFKKKNFFNSIVGHFMTENSVTYIQIPSQCFLFLFVFLLVLH